MGSGDWEKKEWCEAGENRERHKDNNDDDANKAQKVCRVTEATQRHMHAPGCVQQAPVPRQHSLQLLHQSADRQTDKSTGGCCRCIASHLQTASKLTARKGDRVRWVENKVTWAMASGQCNEGLVCEACTIPAILVDAIVAQVGHKQPAVAGVEYAAVSMRAVLAVAHVVLRWQRCVYRCVWMRVYRYVGRVSVRRSCAPGAS